jgi:hypothetical protein
VGTGSTTFYAFALPSAGDGQTAGR